MVKATEAWEGVPRCTGAAIHSAFPWLCIPQLHRFNRPIAGKPAPTGKWAEPALTETDDQPYE